MLMMYYTNCQRLDAQLFLQILTGAFSGLSSDAVSGVLVEYWKAPARWAAYGADRRARLCDLQLRPAKRRGAHHQGDDVRADRADCRCWPCTASPSPARRTGLRSSFCPIGGAPWSRESAAFSFLAMNQAFFTLSLGIGAMEIFGSYMNRDHTLTGEAVRICALDTFVAVSAGLIIFPACFSYGVSPDAGRASSSSPCRTSSPAWRAAACGARCSSCL